MTANSLLLAVALTASTAVLARTSVNRPTPATHGGRPIVLLVHGRGFLSRDSVAFRRQALSALREGAFRATGDSLFGDDDLRLVWYADLMDTRRQNMRSARACEAAADSAETGLSAASILRSLALVASELLDAGATETGAADARDLAGDLRFLGDGATRCAAEGRVAAALARARDEGRPVVIVAHSLGALVAWGHLEHRRTSSEPQLPAVQRLITLGSPIGSGDLRELLFGDTAVVALPRGVQSWVNVIHEDDPFAARLLATDSTTGRSRVLPGISDVMTEHADDDAHDLRGYLRDPGTARAVLAAWCEWAESKTPIAGCAPPGFESPARRPAPWRW